MPTPKESLQTLTQIAQDFGNTLSPAAQKFYIPGAQAAVRDIEAAFTELDSLRTKIEADAVAKAMLDAKKQD
jgi:hypothetical protein